MSTKRIRSITVAYEDGTSETWNGPGRVNMVSTIQETDSGPKSVIRTPLRYITASLTPDTPDPAETAVPIPAGGSDGGV